MSIHNEWLHKEFIDQEAAFDHRPLEDEMSFYKAVQNGDIEYVLDNCKKNVFTNPEGMGTLSKNPLQNLKFHFVVTVAMVTRFCAEGGMELEKAYRLSDFYIQKADLCRTSNELSSLHKTMCLDYTKKMHALIKETFLSKPIVLCLDYIYDHRNDRITVAKLAEHVNLSESYLSKLFKNEMNICIADYIRNSKLESAKNLLKFSNFSLIEISNYLSFSSQSHFSQVFEKETGLTPKKYRDKYFRKNW